MVRGWGNVIFRYCWWLSCQFEIASVAPATSGSFQSCDVVALSEDSRMLEEILGGWAFPIVDDEQDGLNNVVSTASRKFISGIAARGLLGLLGTSWEALPKLH